MAVDLSMPVLVVDDYKTMIRIIRNLLKQLGFSDVDDAADGTEPADRVKLLKLAWDAVGSEFASRHTQYEMFYAGAQFVTRGHSFRTYDWDKATSLVTTISDRYDLAGTQKSTGKAAAE